MTVSKILSVSHRIMAVLKVETDIITRIVASRDNFQYQSQFVDTESTEIKGKMSKLPIIENKIKKIILSTYIYHKFFSLWVLWFFSTYKTDHHNKTEILLKVA